MGVFKSEGRIMCEEFLFDLSEFGEVFLVGIGVGVGCVLEGKRKERE
jgi:hypothetical protein